MSDKKCWSCGEEINESKKLSLPNEDGTGFILRQLCDDCIRCYRGTFITGIFPDGKYEHVLRTHDLDEITRDVARDEGWIDTGRNRPNVKPGQYIRLIHLNPDYSVNMWGLFTAEVIEDTRIYVRRVKTSLDKKPERQGLYLL